MDFRRDDEDVIVTVPEISLPPGSDYFSLSITVFIQGLLFAFHNHGKSPLDAHVHIMFVIAIAVTFFSILIEWKKSDQLLAVLFRSFCFLVQGLWLVQIAFILYNPISGHEPWNRDNNDSIMMATALFGIHILSAIIVIGLIRIFN